MDACTNTCVNVYVFTYARIRVFQMPHACLCASLCIFLHEININHLFSCTTKLLLLLVLCVKWNVSFIRHLLLWHFHLVFTNTRLVPLEKSFYGNIFGEKKYPQWLRCKTFCSCRSYYLDLPFQFPIWSGINSKCWKFGISEIKVVLFEICQYKVLSWNIEQLPSSMSSNLPNKSFLAQVHLPGYSQSVKSKI